MGIVLGISAEIPAGSLDLVYLDPPFFTNREFVGKGKEMALGIRWSGVAATRPPLTFI